MKKYKVPSIEIVQLSVHERLCGGDLLTGSGLNGNTSGQSGMGGAPKKRVF